MKNHHYIPLTLLAMLICATSSIAQSQPLIISGGETTITPSGTNYYEYLQFSGSGTLKHTKNSTYIRLNGTTGDYAGNIIVDENVTATINQDDQDGLYLKEGAASTSVGKIIGANKETSILNFNGNLIGTSQADADKQAMEINNITLNIKYVQNYNQNTLRAAWFKFDNAKFVVKTPDVENKMTKLEAGGYTNATNSRVFQFYNSQIDIESGATLYTGYRSGFTGSRAIHLDNSTLNVSGTLDLATNWTYLNIEDGSEINLMAGGIIKSTKSVKINNATLNLKNDFSIASEAELTLMKGKTMVANIEENTTFTVNELVAQSSSTIDLNGKGSFTSSLITASDNTKLDISVAKANILEITVAANSTLLIDVASSSEAYIGLIRTSEGNTFDIALSDTIMKDSLLIASADDLSIYNPEDSSFRFVTETGALRELGVNLWIEETEANSGVFTIYTAQVPEPAEWAVIFAVCALAFVAYRKRR